MATRNAIKEQASAPLARIGVDTSGPVDPIAIANELGLKVYNATFDDEGIHGLIAKRPSNTSQDRASLSPCSSMGRVEVGLLPVRHRLSICARQARFQGSCPSAWATPASWRRGAYRAVRPQSGEVQRTSYAPKKHAAPLCARIPSDGRCQRVTGWLRPASWSNTQSAAKPKSPHPLGSIRGACLSLEKDRTALRDMTF